MDGFELGVRDGELRKDVQFELFVFRRLVLQHLTFQFLHRLADPIRRRRNEARVFRASSQRSDDRLFLPVAALREVLRRVLHKNRVQVVDECKVDGGSTPHSDRFQSVLQRLHVALGDNDVGGQAVEAKGGFVHQQLVQIGLCPFDLGTLHGFASGQGAGDQIRGRPLLHGLFQPGQACVGVGEQLTVA